MAATAIGLDVGTNAVRAVEIELDHTPVIRRMGQVGLPVGAVVDGEVADVAAVSAALQRLWNEVRFRSRTVRVGMSSARVIVRTIEMPRLPRDELISTISLQLDDYVPLPAEETVFDIRELDTSGPPDHEMQLLLAATHRDAVQPLMMALRDANLDVAAVDVIPAALALALTRAGATTEGIDETQGGDERGGAVDVVLSVGAGTVIVVAAHDGEPVFSRTLTSAAGRLTTERIASELSVGEHDAETYKRLGAADDHTSSVALLAALASAEELVDEVRASLAFYAAQPSARPVGRILLTGGGSLLPGLSDALAERLGIEVEPADPFATLHLGHTGFEPCDLPYLAPYMAAAIGVALGAGRPKDRRIDLTPVATRVRHAPATRRLLASAGAVVLVGSAGALYINGRSELSSNRSQLATATAELQSLQTQINDRVSFVDEPQSTGGPSAAEIAASAASTDVDWLAVELAVEEGGAPLGVTVLSFQGVLDEPAAAVAGSSTPPLAKLTLTATAPRLSAVADWLDSLEADPRFTDPWATGLTTIVQQDGASVVQFTLEVGLTAGNLVTASSPKEAAG